MTHRSRRLGGLALAAALFFAACSSGAAPSASTAGAPGTAATPPPATLSGKIVIDGSSTVYPITEAVAEEFQKANPGVKITVAFSGTGGGFKKFCAAETDINDASRPIKTEDKPDAKSEATLCKDAGIGYLQLGIAIDALSVVVNPANDWAPCLTTAQLKQIWNQGSTVTKWSDIDPSWPAEPIKLYGPGADSGTFDYFTEVINGKAKQSRADYAQ